MSYKLDEWIPVKGINDVYFRKSIVVPIADPSTKQKSREFGYQVIWSQNPNKATSHELGWVDVFDKGYLICHKHKWIYVSRLPIAIKKLYDWYVPNYFSDLL